MNKSANELFQTLVEKDPRDLTPEEIKFLKARRDYLSPVQRELLGEVLELTDDERVLSKSQMKRLKELQKETELQAKKEEKIAADREKARAAKAAELNGGAAPVENDSDDVDETEQLGDETEQSDSDVEVMTEDAKGNPKPLAKPTKKKK